MDATIDATPTVRVGKLDHFASRDLSSVSGGGIGQSLFLPPQGRIFRFEVFDIITF